MFDMIVVGGSYSGMAAALQVARAHRKVLVIDAGQRRNRFAAASHGFLSRDGEPPQAIAAEAQKQLLAYPGVTWVDAIAIAAHGSLDVFSVTTADGPSFDGRSFDGRRLVLATGVVDILPDLPGLEQQWGRTAFHCPYCHGYELARGRLGVLATGALSFHQAMMIPDWGSTTLLTNNAFAPDPEQHAALSARGVAIESAPVLSASGEADAIALHLEGGRKLVFDGLFLAPRTRLAGPLAEQLGCALQDGPFGQIIATDETKATSVAGVYACGDTARAMASLSFAVADGAMAGAAAHRSLIFQQAH